jgi:uncharacterized protein YbjQ (UPF0145 family)
MLVVTTNELEGYRIVRHLGLVRGLTVRSRSVVGNLGAAIQIFFGGNITVYTKLAEQTRQEAFNLLVAHAQEMGANAQNQGLQNPGSQNPSPWQGGPPGINR